MIDYTKINHNTDEGHLNLLWDIWDRLLASDPIVSDDEGEYPKLNNMFGIDEIIELEYADRMCVREAIIGEKWEKNRGKMVTRVTKVGQYFVRQLRP